MKKLIMTVVAVLFSAALFAADLETTAAASAAGVFAGVDIGARASGMGNARVALSSGSEALFVNPAGTKVLALSDSILVNHNTWLADMFQETLSYVRNAGAAGAFGLGISYFSEGKLEKYTVDSIGNPVKSGDIFPFAAIAKLNWSKDFMLKDDQILYIGVNAGYALESIDSTSNGAVLFDAGIKLRGLVKNLAIAVSARNLGTEMKGFGTEKDIIAGVGYVLKVRGSDYLSMEADARYVSSTTFSAAGGLEYAINGLYFIRAGYEYNNSGIEEGLTGLRGGIGVKINKFQIDYAAEFYGELGMSHKASLLIEL